MEHFLNTILFPVTVNFEDIVFSPEQQMQLSQPSGLHLVNLISNLNNLKLRTLDFTNTTNEEAIRKIITFYKHGTYRRLINNHIYSVGFDDELCPMGYPVLLLSS